MGKLGFLGLRRRGGGLRARRSAVLLATLGLMLVLAGPGATSTASSKSFGSDDSFCVSYSSLCADAYTNPGDEYVGHDEPSLEFKSGEAGSGNDITYNVTLPDDPPTKPKQDGSGGTWNFQLRPTFWFGLTLCDSESAPEYTKTCTPDSDANNLVGTNPAAPDYIGKHPGNAYMELQFYGPGYVPQFEGFGCAANKYCAAMTIDSRTLDQNTGIENTRACNRYILGGPEPINWAYITKSGVSQAPADPLFTGTGANPNFSAVNPDFNRDLMMSPGDPITIHMYDTPAGFRIDLTDQKTRETGSMTASVANGFAHILYTPGASTCTSVPYAFHPEYSTANPRGNTWSAHTYNVAFSDEIGHFENCLELDANANCAVAGAADPGGLDEDDGNNFCVPGKDAWVVHINGCFSDDVDFDGPSYQNDWPGSIPDPKTDQKVHPQPVLFTSPTTKGGHDYPTIAFETDLPRVEPTCDVATGTGCTNPPPGAAFYPFFSTTVANGTCTWQEGGPFLPNTVNDYGGSASAEYGPLLLTTYPVPGPTTVQLFTNFNSGDLPNGCPAGP
jgi:hypothetical protein